MIMPHLENLMTDLLSMTKGIVVKRVDVADRYETLEIIQAADYYISAVNKTDTFWTYIKYPEWILRKSGLTDEEVELAMLSKVNIPESAKELVFLNMHNNILESYVEKNNYYRRLGGLPDIEDPMYIYLDFDVIGVDNSKPLHEMNIDEIMILTQLGTIDAYKKAFPSKLYLSYLGVNKIDIFYARRASRFDILQLGPCGNEYHRTIFMKNYEFAKRYIGATAYNREMFGDQEHYDSYIGLLIVTQAMQQCISENLTILTTKSYNDVQTCKYILQSYGLDIFDDIPIKYRKAIADNIEVLIQNKGTDAVFELIYKIFGFKHADVFKYYIVKERKRDADGNPIIDADKSNMYDLSMASVSISSKNVALDIRDQTNQLDYGDVVRKDPYWGVYETDASVEDKLLDFNFNYFDSKYIAINTAYDLTKMNYEINYVMSTLLALKSYEGGIKIMTQDSVAQIPVFDAIVYLFALISKQSGYAGNIPSSMSGVASVYRFNFESNATELQEIYNEFGTAGISGILDLSTINIVKPLGRIENTVELLNYYFKNTDIYNTLVNAMAKAKTKQQYMLIKKLFNYLTTSKQTNEIYKKSNGEVASTYYDFLLDSQPVLAFVIESIGVEFIGDKIIEVLSELEAYISSDKLTYMFTRMPTTNDVAMKKYIAKVISVFKSYTIDIESMNMVYEVDDKSANAFRIFDDTIKAETRSSATPNHILTGIGIGENLVRSDNFGIYDECQITTIRGGIEYEF
jgi:hypothetical protein